MRCEYVDPDTKDAVRTRLHGEPSAVGTRSDQGLRVTPPRWGHWSVTTTIPTQPTPSRSMRPDELERRLRARLDALGQTFAELLIDAEEDRTFRRCWSGCCGR